MGVKKIAVLGDVCADVLEVSTPSRKRTLSETVSNWRLYPETYLHMLPGGALLLAEFIQAACDGEVVGLDGVDLDKPQHDRILQSHLKLGTFPKTLGSKETTLRLRRYAGFSGSENAPLLPCIASAKDVSLLVLDDPGNGFRYEPSAWQAALRTLPKRSPIILNMCRPLMKGQLWDYLAKSYRDNLLLVLSADDLRTVGVQISKRLSWERTSKDLVWQLENNVLLRPLRRCGHVIVRFGIDAAIYTRNTGKTSLSQLCFDPSSVEDGFAETMPGTMPGLTYALVASLAAAIDRTGNFEELTSGIHAGIRSARALLRTGFKVENAAPRYPIPEIFSPTDSDKTRLGCVEISLTKSGKDADPGFWRILDQLSEKRLEEMAFRIVRQGVERSLGEVPSGRFRHLHTVDRAEIEHFRAIQNLMREYVSREKTKRPLCIAVFGPPGAGKSFGVAEVAETVAPGKVRMIEFNVSQFDSPDDLIDALHKVRDSVLEGQIPLVFFDEFDSGYGGKLGWLKYFLAPMQDGKFRDGESIHPIGKSIFVFAGGTRDSFEAFSADGVPGTAESAGWFRDAKGTDFVSRLRGFVDVLGPNPRDEKDKVFIVRRAMLLRSLLERLTPQLVDDEDYARVDPGVLRALIHVPDYRHGIRSMEAILDMSSLSNALSFEQAALPPANQLRLHVDPEIFERLVLQDASFGAVREQLAQAIHERFVRDQAGNRPQSDEAMQPWDELLETYKEANRRQADHIPEKLKAISCSFTPFTQQPVSPINFSKKEIEIMARMEHDRWVRERLEEGYTPGPRNPIKKTSPYLGSWETLDDKVKEFDRNTVRAIPDLMTSVGFRIYRLS
ncbi:MAG: hypothetical protein AMXMBFR82_38250 [Candidatus Hydrogenedentota bacterium]